MPRTAAPQLLGLIAILAGSGCLSLGYRRASDDFKGVQDQFAAGVRMTGISLDPNSKLFFDVGVEAANVSGGSEQWGQISVTSKDYHLGVLVPFVNTDVEFGFYDRFMAYFGFGASYVDVAARFDDETESAGEVGGGYMTWGVFYMGTETSASTGALGLSVKYTMAPSLHLGNEYVEAGGMSVSLVFIIPEY